MTSNNPAIRFVLYSEDRTDANNDFRVLREILRGMIKHLRADVKLNHVIIAPLQPVSKKRICGSYWKVTSRAKDPGAQDLRRQLIFDVASEIRLGRVVFFHVDADDTWGRNAVCENACEHWPRFLRDVQAVLSRQARPPVTQTPLEQVLVLAMPFYEMESWAFANLSYLRNVVSASKDVENVNRWAVDLGLLDEERNTKDSLSIRDSMNAELVQQKNGFPVAVLAALGRSYADTLGRLRNSQVVREGLHEAANRPF